MRKLRRMNRRLNRRLNRLPARQWWSLVAVLIAVILLLAYKVSAM